MRVLILILICFFAGTNLAIAESGRTSPQSMGQRLDKVEHDLTLIKDSQTELRRDELNYKIEKDLLKDSYNTSLQTVNAALTFILGLLAVLGYLGIRDISAMKKEYADDLEKLGELKKQFESELGKIGAEQQTVREELSNILVANKQQDNRIKVLEIQEQVNALVGERNFTRALDYISIGLEIAPNDFILMTQEAHCLTKLYRFEEAIEVSKKIIQNRPEDAGTGVIVANLAEMLIVLGKTEESKQLITTHKEKLQSYSSALLMYFDMLEGLFFSDPIRMKASITTFVTPQLLPSQQQWMPGWDFSDAHLLLETCTNDEAKRIYTQTVSFLNGSMPAQQLLESLGTYDLPPIVVPRDTE